MGSSTGAQDTFQKDVQKPTMLGTQPSLDGSLSSPGGVTPSQRQRATVRVHAPPARRPSEAQGCSAAAGPGATSTPASSPGSGPASPALPPAGAGLGPEGPFCTASPSTHGRPSGHGFSAGPSAQSSRPGTWPPASPTLGSWSSGFFSLSSASRLPLTQNFPLDFLVGLLRISSRENRH